MNGAESTAFLIDWYISEFPQLTHENFSIESAPMRDYNCIAWTAGDTENWWWPQEDSFWPKGIPNDETVSTFVKLYESLGYTYCEEKEFEEGIEKVAIYAIGDRVTHASRQLPNGNWTSKLGCSHDIEHSLEGLENSEYGIVVRILCRSSSINAN